MEIFGVGIFIQAPSPSLAFGLLVRLTRRASCFIIECRYADELWFALWN